MDSSYRLLRDAGCWRAGSGPRAGYGVNVCALICLFVLAAFFFICIVFLTRHTSCARRPLSPHSRQRHNALTTRSIHYRVCRGCLSLTAPMARSPISDKAVGVPPALCSVRHESSVAQCQKRKSARRWPELLRSYKHGGGFRDMYKIQQTTTAPPPAPPPPGGPCTEHGATVALCT